MRFSAVFIFIFLLVCGVFAQSGRVVQNSAAPTDANQTNDGNVRALYEEAEAFYKKKANEYNQKKIPYSDRLDRQIVLEQKQLAAKNAALAAKNATLGGEDFYYLGQLYWLSDNADGAAENFAVFAASENPDVEKLQTARAVLSITAARRQKFDEAEKFLSDYLKTDPVKLRERAGVENELASNYYKAKVYEKSAAHAREALRAQKALLQDSASRAKGLDEIVSASVTLYKINRDSGKTGEADTALRDLRETAIFVSSPSMYAFAVDRQIRYKIETDRKPEALKDYQNALVETGKVFLQKSFQQDAYGRIKNRERQYKLLGENAFELEDVEKWFPGQKKTIAELRGKVVFLDFWATWCMPCLEAFPHLIEWNQEFKKDGLEILGVTRFYGEQVGAATDAEEIAFLEDFRKKEALPYDFVVSRGQTNQINFAATGLPTVVMIDRKGVIRFVESGTNAERIKDMRETIVRLLAEK